MAQGIGIAYKGDRAGQLGCTANWLASLNDTLMRTTIALG
jgi:hypothetical protein